MKTFVNPKYERREGEDTFEYGLRLIEIKVEQKPDDLEWGDIVEATGMDCHRDSLRKAASVTPYSGYAVAQYFKKKLAAQCNPNQADYMGELDCKIAEMRKEAKRFYDQRREFNKMVDRIGREENLEDRLVVAAQSLNELVPLSINKTSDFIDQNAEAVIVFAAWLQRTFGIGTIPKYVVTVWSDWWSGRPNVSGKMGAVSYTSSFWAIWPMVLFIPVLVSRLRSWYATKSCKCPRSLHKRSAPWLMRSIKQ